MGKVGVIVKASWRFRCGSLHILSEENSSAGIESVVTLMFQKHPLFQGKWDYARKIRCSVLPK